MLALRELRAARRKRKGVESRHAHFDPRIPSPPVRQFSRDSYGNSDGGIPPPLSTPSTYLESVRRRDDDASVTSSLYNDIEEFVLESQEQDEAKRKAATEERATAEMMAVEVYKKQLIETVEQSHGHVEQTRTRLSKLFDVLPDAPAIEAYLSEIREQRLASDEVAQKVYAQLGGSHLPVNPEMKPDISRGKTDRGPRYDPYYHQSKGR